MKVYLDIGANNGSDSIQLAQDLDNFVIAFEPVPQIAKKLFEKVRYTPNYRVYGLAVDRENTIKSFYLNPEIEYQCSSLFDFVDNFDQWPKQKRGWFKNEKKIEVECIRVDTFLEKYYPHINEIEYMHCDTQGNDLAVLESFGSKINMLKAGKVETIVKPERSLYKNQENTLNNIRSFLVANNFEIVEYLPANYQDGNECDVVFKRK